MTDDVQLEDFVRDVPDWPSPGVGFKDLTPLLADPTAFASAVDRLVEPFADRGITKVLGIEARGFVLAAPVALRLGAGLVLARKPGKLPWHTEAEEYSLEYGTDRLEVHVDAITPGERVVIVDDVMATGGTAAAAARLVERLGGEVAGLGFVLELAFLRGAERLQGRDYTALIASERPT